jgi:hypothetical protein
MWVFGPDGPVFRLIYNTTAWVARHPKLDLESKSL